MSELDLADRVVGDPRPYVAFGPPGPEQRQILDLIDTYTDGNPGVLDRTCRPGHLTASALVVDPSNLQILLLFHTKLQRWLQPGGHADGDADLTRVALREATEETGIDGLRIVEPPIDLDVHVVDPPAEDLHEHHDVRYLVVAPPGSVPFGNHESEELRWVDKTSLSSLGVDIGLIRLAERALTRLEELTG
ncbi:MAG: NUDIX hydrolase [Acidimicrobiales bacterium]|nr:NUDIX hydrolase [Acidimicrobiales bacterium]